MSPQDARTELFAPLPEDCTSRPDAAEQEVLELWKAEDTFRAVQHARRDATPFVFWEGPPTANGRPGIHHVLSRTLKDTVCRFQTMLGRRVERKAGWDTHGLPVELEVEKQLGISGKPEIEDYGVAEFNQKCRESVWKYREDWEQISQRIGYWLDYDDPYVTYDPRYVDSVWYLLARFHREGLVYRGKRVLPYCGRCGTGLSSHELGQPGVYRDVMDPSVTLRFRLREPAGDEPESFLAWTTTPWTLPSNFALAVHPERDYVRVRVTGKDGAREIVWVVAERAEAVLGKEREELERRKGAELVGTRYLPLFDTLPPFADPGAWEPETDAIHQVVAGEFVTVEDGTGIVHQAPYGADDWEMARAHRMPLPEAVGPEGKLVCDVGPVPAGTFFKDADNALMDDLKARGLLFKKARESHSYPHCWRCDTPLFYFPAPAWYIRTTSIKERMIERNREIGWVPPEVGEKRFGEWLANNIDWNISRDRYWGTPLPFWICEGCEVEEALGSADEMAERAGGLPDAFDHHKPSIDEVTFPCASCGGTMRRTNSVVDCWFDSGSMPFAQYNWPHGEAAREKVADQFPADFICEGLDQTRGWFYTLHAIGAFMTGLDEKLEVAPAYKTCMVNGLVLDKDGVKMSKRLGNVIDPWEMVGEHGADAVRWYFVSSAAPWLPKRLDRAGPGEIRRRFLSTLLNSYGFFREYARIDEYDPASGAIPPLAERPEIDRWLVSRTQSVAAEARARFADFDLTGAARAIEGFVVDELSNWYIRRNRRRFWKGDTGPDKLSAYASLQESLRTVALAMAPLAPFHSELLWQRLSDRAGSVHAELYPELDEACLDRGLEAEMDVVQRVVVMGRALRERAGMKVRQPLRALHVRSSDEASLKLLQASFASEQILDELNVKSWGSLGADDGKLCRLTAKANFRTLGKRLGPRMKAAAAAIGGLDADALSALRAGETASIELDGEAFELAPEDVQIAVESQAEFDVETDGTFIVWLDTELDDELIAEGVAREVVTTVNGVRKQAGLKIEERIELRYCTDADPLAGAVESHRDFIMRETLATDLARVEQRAAIQVGASLELDGRELFIGLA
jgi:isoleucyl-tRNA synthetase